MLFMSQNPPAKMTGTTDLMLSSKRSVPRCLFGPPDPRTAEFAKEKVREIYESDKTRYNFDFDAEKPLQGPLKWEAVPVAPPTTTADSGNYAPKAYALSRFPYLSGSVDRERDMASPPPLMPRTNINNNQLPPTRELYFEPNREPLLIVRGAEEESRVRSRPAPSSTVTSSSSSLSSPMKSSSRPSKSSSATSSTHSSSTVTSEYRHMFHRLHQSPSLSSSSSHPFGRASMALSSPDASSCSSEDSANVDMEFPEEELDTSVGSPSTEEELKSISNESSSQPTSATGTTTHPSSSSSGLSSRVSSSSVSSSDSRRTKSVSSSSSSPSASPSSPSSSQPQITKFMPTVRKRQASASTGKAASKSAPASSPAAKKKRAAL